MHAEDPAFPQSRLIQFALAGAICVSPTAVLWPFLFPEQPGHALTNLADPSLPRKLVLWQLGGVFLVAPLYLVRWLRCHSRDGAGLLAAVRWANGRLLVFAALPFLAALQASGIEKTAPFLTLLLIAVIAVFTGVSAYHWTASLPARAPQSAGTTHGAPSAAHWAALLAVVVGIALYTVLLSHFSIMNFRYLRVSSFDLAIYNSLLWNTSHGDFLATTLQRGGTHMSAHFDPILGLLAPFYLLSPRAETLLIFQSLWLASAAIPLFLLSSRTLSNPWFAAVIAAAFLLHPALHGINMYEFHSLAIVAPLLAWAVYFAETGRFRAYWVVFALILLTREDMSLLSCALGLYLIDGLRRPKAGIVTIACALTYLTLVKFFVMPDSGLLMSGQGDSYSYRTHFEQMIPHKGGGASELILTLLTNPVFAIRVATEESKLLFVLLILLPSGFLAFFTRGRLFLLLYTAVFCLLSSKPGPHSIYKQYTSMLIPLVFALLPLGLWRVSESRWLREAKATPKRVRLGMLVYVAIASILLSWKFGIFVENDVFRTGGWKRPPHFEPAAMRREWQRRYEFLDTLVQKIPESASVSATRFLVPHISNRQKAYIYPTGKHADYLLINLQILGDDALKRFNTVRANPAFETVDEGEGFVLLRRVSPAKAD